MKIFSAIILLVLSVSNIQAETLKIASGEYSPYSGEHIPMQGLSTMIIKAAFKETKHDVQVDFMPWKRAMKYTEEAVVVGSYPWNKNESRYKYNYFSLPIHQYRVLTFHKKGKSFNSEKEVRGKTLCHPAGWDLGPYAHFVKKMDLQVVHPINAESCFNMMVLGRVDLVLMNELVALDIIKKLFKEDSPIIGSEKEYFKKRVNLHFIISRKYQNGRKIMNDFNLGLQKIKSNGVYDSIVKTKANCEICNQLGSL